MSELLRKDGPDVEWEFLIKVSESDDPVRRVVKAPTSSAAERKVRESEGKVLRYTMCRL